MRLLIVEDDAELRESLKINFETEGFAVDCAEDGERGSYFARTNEYDLIVLDNILPKKSGLDVCKELRAAGKASRILLISTKSELPSKIALLDHGADDYVTKPFSFLELLARTRAILRRPLVVQENILRSDDLMLDKNRHKVFRGEEEIYLTRKEFMLLEFILEQKGNFVSRGTIMEHVWDVSVDPFSNTIETHIMNLRKKIDGGRRKKMIHTIPGRGYQINS